MRVASVALMILVAATGASAGEGFLAQIPEPGTWVKYHRTQKNSRERQVIKDFSGSFTVRYLKETSDKDIPRRWIEFELEVGEATISTIPPLLTFRHPAGFAPADIETLLSDHFDPVATRPST